MTTFLVLLVTLGLQAPQIPPPQTTIPAGAAAISGRVVDRDTERLLEGVMVTLTTADARSALVTETDRAGLYAFEGIAAGEYRLTARHSDYVLRVFGVPDTGSTGLRDEGVVRLTARQRRSDVDFALSRGGSVSGRITSHDGQPLENAQVMIMSIPTTSGNRMIGAGGMSRTDANGRYEVRNIAEGTYVVLATWIDRDAARNGGRLEFKPTLFPGTERQSEATPLKIAPGDRHANVDFSFRPTETFRIAGHVLRGGSHGRIQAYLISPGNAVRSFTVADDGAFTVPQLKPGQHTLVARADTDDSAEAAVLTFDLSEDMSGLLLGLSPTATITGRVATSDGGPVPEGLYLTAMLAKDANEIDPLPRDRVEVAADGTFVFPAIFGERILRTSVADAWTVDRVVVGKSTVTSITVQPGQALDGVVVLIKRR